MGNTLGWPKVKVVGAVALAIALFGGQCVLADDDAARVTRRAQVRDLDQPATSSPPRARAGEADSAARVRRGAARGRDGSETTAAYAGGRGGGIFFAEARDFATGANPSAHEFNRTSGDQLGPTMVADHTTISDAVAAGDFDEDGRLDVAQTNVVAASLSVFLGDGRGGFATPRVIPTGAQPTSVVARRIDRDRHLDLVVVAFGAKTVTVLWGDGAGGFEAAAPIPLAAPPRNVAPGRFDDDGVVDLAVATAGPSCVRGGPNPCLEDSGSDGGVAVFTGSVDHARRMSFVHANDIALVRNGRRTGANYVVAGDLDGNGRDDLAVGVGASPSAGDRPAASTEPTGDDLLVFRNQNTPDGPAFTASPSQRFRVGATPDAIKVGDWNDDGRADLAVLDTCSGDVTTLLGTKSGGFAKKATNVTVGALPRSLESADFDGDGVADLVTASFAASTLSVLRGNGDGTFEPAVDFWAGNAPTGADVGNFDADKRPDVVVGRLRTDQLALVRNDARGSGDGVRVVRDIGYGDPDSNPSGDPYGAHHSLDVYVPPPGTTPIAATGRPYPVVLFAHGGAGTMGDKSQVSLLMRSLALAGVVAVSANYRLTGQNLADVQTRDFAAAFAWVRANIAGFGGDPDAIVIAGHSQGGVLVGRFAVTPAYVQARLHLRGVVIAGIKPEEPKVPGFPPFVVFNGDEGIEVEHYEGSADNVATANQVGNDGKAVLVRGRDHFTLVAGLSRDGDFGRAELLAFLRRVTR